MCSGAPTCNKEADLGKSKISPVDTECMIFCLYNDVEGYYWGEVGCKEKCPSRFAYIGGKVNKSQARKACSDKGNLWSLAYVDSAAEAIDMWDFLKGDSSYNCSVWIENSCSDIMIHRTELQIGLDCSAPDIVLTIASGCDGGGGCMFGDTFGNTTGHYCSFCECNEQP